MDTWNPWNPSPWRPVQGLGHGAVDSDYLGLVGEVLFLLEAEAAAAEGDVQRRHSPSCWKTVTPEERARRAREAADSWKRLANRTPQGRLGNRCLETYRAHGEAERARRASELADEIAQRMATGEGKEPQGGPERAGKRAVLALSTKKARKALVRVLSKGPARIRGNGFRRPYRSALTLAQAVAAEVLGAERICCGRTIRERVVVESGLACSVTILGGRPSHRRAERESRWTWSPQEAAAAVARDRPEVSPGGSPLRCSAATGGRSGIESGWRRGRAASRGRCSFSKGP